MSDLFRETPIVGHFNVIPLGNPPKNTINFSYEILFFIEKIKTLVEKFGRF